MSFLRWIGGKHQLQKDIYSIIENVDTSNLDYYEPFLGSGVILIKMLENNKFRDYYVSDINDYLINTHLCVKHNIDELIDWLEILNRDLSKETFYKWRKVFNDLKPHEMYTPFMAALFIYLNKTCWRSMYGENRKGEFNIPYGYINRKIYDEQRLRHISELYRKHDVKFGIHSYEETACKNNSFFYLDPPYEGTYNKYTKYGFSDSDFHDYLDLVSKNNLVILSNSGEFQLPPGFVVHYKTMRDRVNRQESHRKEILAFSASLQSTPETHINNSSDSSASP